MSEISNVFDNAKITLKKEIRDHDMIYNSYTSGFING